MSTPSESSVVSNDAAVPSLPVDIWRWRHMILSAYGPRAPSHRIVASVIGLYMSAARSDCWVGQRTIAERAQLSVRQVRRVIGALETSGWLRTRYSMRKGQAWRLTVYSRRLPTSLSHVDPRKASVPKDDERTEECDRRGTRDGCESQDNLASADVSTDGESPPRRFQGPDVQMTSRTSGSSESRTENGSFPLDVRRNSEGHSEGLPESCCEARTVRTTGHSGADTSDEGHGHLGADVGSPGCPINIPSNISQKNLPCAIPSLRGRRPRGAKGGGRASMRISRRSNAIDV